MFTIGETVDLAELIINVTCIVKLIIRAKVVSSSQTLEE